MSRSFVLSLTVLLASASVYAERRCHEEPAEPRCSQVCDGGGKNCTRQCFPQTRTVCVEVSPPPQEVRPAGGTVKGPDGKTNGAWGGVTVPLK